MGENTIDWLLCKACVESAVAGVDAVDCFFGPPILSDSFGSADFGAGAAVSLVGCGVGSAAGGTGAFSFLSSLSSFFSSFRGVLDLHLNLLVFLKTTDAFPICSTFQ